MRNFLEEFHFDTKWLSECQDNTEIDKQFEELRNHARLLSKTKQKALMFIYYSGHGTLIDGVTVGNTLQGTKFDLETQVRKLAIYSNMYVVGLFDCCRSIAPMQSKGAEAVPEKVVGQLCIIHAVAPSKSAITQQTGNSEVTKSFLQLLRTSNDTFPSCVSKWAKSHKTVEIVDKCLYEVGLKAPPCTAAETPEKQQTEAPSATSEKQQVPETKSASKQPSLEAAQQWTVADVCSWLKSLSLANDITPVAQEQGIDGSVLQMIIKDEMWKDFGIKAMGDVIKIKKAWQQLPPT